jgi:hypothetical protein
MRLVLIFTGILSFVLNWFYIAYGSDKLGAITGTSVALFVVPFIGWALLIVSLALLMRVQTVSNVGEYWIWLLPSMFCAYLPVLFLWVAFSSV